MISIEDSYKNSLEQEKKLLAKCRALDNLKDIAGFTRSISSKNKSKFLFNFFVRKNLKASKQNLFTYGKCDEFGFNNFRKSNPIIQRTFYLLLSDSKELINSFKNWEFNNHEHWVKHGALVIVIQEILKDNNEKALELLKRFDEKHKKYSLKEQDSAILKSIINNNKEAIEELLQFFLLPKNHKKVNDTLMLHSNLFSLHVTGFAKLAWLKGIQVQVDHTLLPMALLPVKPNKEYVIEYDFLKPDYQLNITHKQELPKPKAKYRKDKPKNKIGVNKALIEQLLKDNWDATYAQKELNNYVDIIYNAFANPQEADRKHYDFAKLGNLHISHSKGDITYLEDKPFTNMWTVLENETDYFFDLLDASFDIIGARLLEDDQFLKIKAQLDTNAKKDKGFFSFLK